MHEVVGIEKKQKGENSLVLKDSTGKVAGFMNDETGYDPTLLHRGFEYIDKGIGLFPDRLDMRFGKIYMLRKIENYEAFTKEIINTIEYSGVNKNKWLWTDNKPEKDPEKFMLDAIQEYVLQLYNTGDDKLLDYMKRISESVLRFYPDHVESLSDLAIVYLLNKDYDKALDPLLKAEKLAPKDFIVLNNLAEAYKNIGDKSNAIKYFKKVQKYGDPEAKKAAGEEIESFK
jgi:tetratricopeptide (TPR) repeat protein